MNQSEGQGAQGNAEPVSHAPARVAFFGGSFDPPHLGHLAIACAARDAFHLDKVLFAPVGAQPLKPKGSSASFVDRLAMTRLAIESEPKFAVSLADAPKPAGAGGSEPNYTLETLKGLRAEFVPDAALYCLMGADAFIGLRQWHRAAEIPFAAALIVASRPGQALEGLNAALPNGLTLEPSPADDRNESGVEIRVFSIANSAGLRGPFYLMPSLHVDFSATQIRESIREAVNTAAQREASVAQAALRTMFPAAVADYIRAHGLYR